MSSSMEFLRNPAAHLYEPVGFYPEGMVPIKPEHRPKKIEHSKGSPAIIHLPGGHASLWMVFDLDGGACEPAMKSQGIQGSWELWGKKFGLPKATLQRMRVNELALPKSRSALLMSLPVFPGAKGELELDLMEPAHAAALSAFGGEGFCAMHLGHCPAPMDKSFAPAIQALLSRFELHWQLPAAKSAPAASRAPRI